MHVGSCNIVLDFCSEIIENHCKFNRTINAKQEHCPQNRPGGEKIGQDSAGRTAPRGTPIKKYRR